MLRFHATPLFRAVIFLTSLAMFLCFGLWTVWSYAKPELAAVDLFAGTSILSLAPFALMPVIVITLAFGIAGIVTDLLCGIPPVHDID